MSITLFALDATELFEVLPETIMQAAWVGDPDQIDRWSALAGDSRDIKEIVTNPDLLAGTAYWVVLTAASGDDGGVIVGEDGLVAK